MWWFVLALWWVSGCASFVRWWTTEFDFVFARDGFVCALAGTVGPLAYLIGWRIHGKASK